MNNIEQAEQLNARLTGRTAEEILKQAIEIFGSKITFATSLGA